MFFNVLYAVALVLYSPVILYRRLRHGRYRRGWRQKLLGLNAAEALALTSGKPCIWLHAVSVGEVNLLRGIVSELDDRKDSLAVVISTSTDTGYDLAVKQYGAERVFFCPLDFSWAVDRTLRHLNPEALVLAELELWPNLIHASKKCGSPVVVINGRLSDTSAARYRRFGALTRPVFRSLSRIECQDESSAVNFALCGAPADRIQVSGSLKFDNAPSSRDSIEVQSRVAWTGLDPWQVVWMVGSTQEGEDAMALAVYNRLRGRFKELRMILVPRHPERFNQVAAEIEASGLVAHRRSRDGSLDELSWEGDRVILVDTVGELRHWWGVCQLATVGGSFGDRGGQNMLEPAGYGCAISFGPNTKNFRHIAEELLRSDAAVRVQGESELERFVESCLVNIPRADSLGRNARAAVQQHRGATERVLLSLNTILAPVTPQRSAA
ncbi:MAG: glycosyltransferase N-terminal domain-containing protein [Planctomycetota bacterium]